MYGKLVFRHSVKWLLNFKLFLPFKGFPSTGYFSIWKPKIEENNNALISIDDTKLNNMENDYITSAIKFFTTKHIMESSDSGLKALCLVPSALGKINIQGTMYIRGGHNSTDRAI